MRMRFIGGVAHGQTRHLSPDSGPTIRVPRPQYSLQSLFDQSAPSDAVHLEVDEYERREIRIDGATFRYRETLMVLRGYSSADVSAALQTLGLPEFKLPEPRWVETDNSKLAIRYGYCPATETLEVTYRDGRNLRYINVTLDTAADLYVADDSEIDSHIKGVADTYAGYNA